MMRLYKPGRNEGDKKAYEIWMNIKKTFDAAFKIVNDQDYQTEQRKLFHESLGIPMQLTAVKGKSNSDESNDDGTNSSTGSDSDSDSDTDADADSDNENTKMLDRTIQSKWIEASTKDFNNHKNTLYDREILVGGKHSKMIHIAKMAVYLKQLDESTSNGIQLKLEVESMKAFADANIAKS